MNDRFKFRVYSFLDKSFIYFDLDEGCPQGIAGGVSEPQQYTDFSDKNGNDIYEGDVLSTYMNDMDKYQKGVVTRAVSGAYVCVYRYIPHDEERSKQIVEFLMNIAQESTIIGHNHEENE